MGSIDILSEEFAQHAAVAGLRARQRALAAGHSVVFIDESGGYIEELPDGRRREVTRIALVALNSGQGRI
jgi:hypothetical protein